MPESELKSVVIVGGGTAGWMTAAAVAKVLGPRLHITLVESDEIGIVGVGEATIPPISLYNDMLRINEDEFLRETQGTFKLGIEFVDWKQRGHAYMHSFGGLGKDLAYIPFHHYWLDEQIRGNPSSLWDYSVDYQAALRGRFGRMDQIPDSPLAGIIYAFHFDAGLYARYLRRKAEAMGVRRVEGKITDVTQHPDTGDIRSVRLENGSEIDGELFIDCSGFRGLLIEQTLKTGYDDWSHWLPCDRAIAVPCERTAPLLPYTRSTAHPAGWQWRIPLQHRTGNGHVFSSAHMSEDQARDILLNNLDGKPLADPRTIRFTTGRRRKYWNKNVIAIGLSSGFLEPLESTSIHLIQATIERLILLFPQRGDNPRLREEFNTMAAVQMDYIRDFIILHYHVNNRIGEPFWDDVRHMSVPDTLTHKIELFRECGTINCPKEDLFQLPSWLQVMWGQGIEPRASHPFVQAVSPSDRAGYLKNIKDLMADAAQRLPTHEQFIARHCAAPSNAPQP